MNEKLSEAAATARARSRIYGLLATVFRAEPTEEFLAAIDGPEMRAILDDLGAAPGIDSAQTPLSETAQALTVEFAGLFLGFGNSVSPHESVHHAAEGGDFGSLWGTETVRVKRFIEAAGLEYRGDYKGIPDHVSVELEFVEKLAEHEARCWEEGKHEDASFTLQIERRFIEEHLAPWVPGLCDKVAERAALPFFREMAMLTKRFLDFETGHEQRPPA